LPVGLRRPLVDVVVVAYRSAAHLRACVEPLAGAPEVRVIVVNNNCPERSPATVADLPLTLVEMGRNAGFGAGCNAGARAGEAEAILFLNPDARIDLADLRRLTQTLEQDRLLGACGPRIVDGAGRTAFTMRREPRLRSAFAEAFFLHHLFPHAAWASEIVRHGYEQPRQAEWLSGAVLCVKREAFTAVGGFDERFFLYSEDTDLCARLRRAGWKVRYEPGAVARHLGGASAPAPGQAALKTAARITYAGLHESRGRYLAFRVSFALHEALRLPIACARSRGHVRGRTAALAVCLGRATAHGP